MDEQDEINNCLLKIRMDLNEYKCFVNQISIEDHIKLLNYNNIDIITITLKLLNGACLKVHLKEMVSTFYYFYKKFDILF